MKNQIDATPVSVFLDATVMVAAAYGGACKMLWSFPGVTLVTNEYAMKEAWLNVPVECQATLIELLEHVSIRPWHADATENMFCAFHLSDPSDRPILMGAIDARCDYLLTADTACFGEYLGKTLEGVTVLRPGKFMAIRGFHRPPKK